jgi:CheY-like chemotaxis protein
MPVRSVLVVDDDWQTRYGLRMALEAAGFAVREATDGANALAQLRQGPPPDLILLDMVMPVMNGWEFRQEQARDPALARVPVVVFSAAYESAPRAAASLGVVRVLQKPVDCGEALTAISDLFGALDATELEATEVSPINE